MQVHGKILRHCSGGESVRPVVRLLPLSRFLSRSGHRSLQCDCHLQDSQSGKQAELKLKGTDRAQFYETETRCLKMDKMCSESR